MTWMKVGEFTGRSLGPYGESIIYTRYAVMWNSENDERREVELDEVWE